MKVNMQKREIESIDIRWSTVGEDIVRTGNVVGKNCIVVERRVGKSWPLMPQFLPIVDGLLTAVTEFVTPVLFHEWITPTGEAIAVPQVPTVDHGSATDWEACIACLQTVPLFTTAMIGYGEKPGEFAVYVDSPKPEIVCRNANFEAQVEAALLPGIIEDTGHPIVRYLLELNSGPQEEDAVEDWLDVD